MRKKIILIQPLQGFSGAFIKHLPLGLIYVSMELVKQGYEIVLLDLRLHHKNWKNKIQEAIDRETLLVGISVMTGKPILNAIDIGKLVKQNDPEIKIVWGGPLPTFHPQYILQDDPNCDYVVSGYGIKSFSELVAAIINGREPEHIQGISYRRGNEIVANPADWTSHEFLDYRDIPYHMIKDYSPYGQFGDGKRVFSLYSAMGCAYKCAFCSSPALYSKIKGKKWVPYPIDAVVDHIQYVVEQYKASYIYFIDDDSFIDIHHVEKIIDEIERRKIDIRLGFRGARINEIKKMSHDYLTRLAKAGTDILHIGAESGSNRILDLIRKNCTVEDILEVNRKLAAHPEIKTHYNFMYGLPTETLDDLKATARLILQLIEENPHGYIGIPNQWRPLPGTELFDIAVREWNYRPPASLIELAEIEVEGEYKLPWLSSEFKKFSDLLLVTSYFVDNKIAKIQTRKNLFYTILKLLSKIYSPMAKFRLRRGFTGLFVERYFYRLANKLITKYLA